MSIFVFYFYVYLLTCLYTILKYNAIVLILCTRILYMLCIDIYIILYVIMILDNSSDTVIDTFFSGIAINAFLCISVYYSFFRHFETLYNILQFIFLFQSTCNHVKFVWQLFIVTQGDLLTTQKAHLLGNDSTLMATRAKYRIPRNALNTCVLRKIDDVYTTGQFLELISIFYILLV